LEKIERSRVVPAGLGAALAYFYVDVLVEGFCGLLTGHPRPTDSGGMHGGWGASVAAILIGFLQFTIVMVGFAAVRPRFRRDASAILCVGLAFGAFAALQAASNADWGRLVLSLVEYPLAVAAGSLALKAGRRLDL
jgi:hypothetical protein